MMRKILLALGAAMMTSTLGWAQTTDKVDNVTDDVQLEIITPAQPVQETEDDVKQREKLLRELQDDVAHAKAANSMRRGYFVLVADNIQIGDMGYRHYDISNNTNFILVQDDDGIIQYALNTGSPGTNGLGGWTGKGKVRNKRIKVEDNGDVYMQFAVVSGSVNADVSITLYGNSNRAVARIMGRPAINIYGKILPYRDSKHR